MTSSVSGRPATVRGPLSSPAAHGPGRAWLVPFPAGAAPLPAQRLRADRSRGAGPVRPGHGIHGEGAGLASAARSYSRSCAGL